MITGDGAEGWQAGAPYDRVIATCTVHRVPYSWVSQTKPGGVILTPWGTPLDNGALLRLSVGEDGTASGPFVDWSVFMWMRAQRFHAPDEPDDFAELATVSAAKVDPAAAFDDTAIFVAGLLVDGCKVAYDRDDEGAPRTYWLLAADSWASIDRATGTVAQFGERRLWDEIEAAHVWWTDLGSPDYTRFGVSVARQQQWTWLDDPENVISSATDRR